MTIKLRIVKLMTWLKHSLTCSNPIPHHYCLLLTVQCWKDSNSDGGPNTPTFHLLNKRFLNLKTFCNVRKQMTSFGPGHSILLYVFGELAVNFYSKYLNFPCLLYNKLASTSSVWATIMAPWNDAVWIEYFLCYQEPVLDGSNITTYRPVVPWCEN